MLYELKMQLLLCEDKSSTIWQTLGSIESGSMVVFLKIVGGLGDGGGTFHCDLYLFCCLPSFARTT